MARLLIFQRACLRSGGTNAHRIDEWMFRFLTEHSLPLGERMDIAETASQEDVSPKSIDSFVEREAFATKALASFWK